MIHLFLLQLKSSGTHAVVSPQPGLENEKNFVHYLAGNVTVILDSFPPAEYHDALPSSSVSAKDHKATTGAIRPIFSFRNSVLTFPAKILQRLLSEVRRYIRISQARMGFKSRLAKSSVDAADR